MKYKIFISILFLVFISSSTYAHRINVFCWVDGQNINCYSKFSTGSPVVEGTYKVFKGNKLIFEGKGDKKGNFTYKIPSNILKNPEDLKFVCIAEMGHKNFWIVKKEELIPSKSNDENIESEDVEEDTNTEKVTSKAIDYKKLNRLFKKTIEQELAPIKRDLAELKEPKIDFRDVLGGIGYIIGFMGIIMYFKSRN